MARFSKQAMLAYLDEHHARLEKKWGFDPNNGTSQIRIGAGADRAIDYGQYAMLQDLAEAIEGGYVIAKESR